jgi:hypothetical protein
LEFLLVALFEHEEISMALVHSTFRSWIEFLEGGFPFAPGVGEQLREIAAPANLKRVLLLLIPDVSLAEAGSSQRLLTASCWRHVRFEPTYI